MTHLPMFSLEPRSPEPIAFSLHSYQEQESHIPAPGKSWPVHISYALPLVDLSLEHRFIEKAIYQVAAQSILRQLRNRYVFRHSSLVTRWQQFDHVHTVPMEFPTPAMGHPATLTLSLAAQQPETTPIVEQQPSQDVQSTKQAHGIAALSLIAEPGQRTPGGWRRMAEILGGEQGIQEIFAEALRLREADTPDS